jgi:biopolymer transport protein ExbB/TolQ
MAALAVWLTLCLAGAAATTWFGFRIWQRRKVMRLPAKLALSIAAVAALAGAIGTVVGLVKAFAAVGGESVDPSQKARILAEGIAEAMNCTAFAILVWIPSVIVAFVLTRKRKGAS